MLKSALVSAVATVRATGQHKVADWLILSTSVRAEDFHGVWGAVRGRISLADATLQQWVPRPAAPDRVFSSDKMNADRSDRRRAYLSSIQMARGVPEIHSSSWGTAIGLVPARMNPI